MKLMAPDLTKLQKILNYTFVKQELLYLALSHRSFGAKNNERLEFLGDSILSVTISDYIYHRFPELTEGELTRMRSSLVQGKTIGKIAKQLQLGDFVLLGSGEKKTGGHQRSSILADTFEAVIGAIYLDSTGERVKEFILSCYQEEFSKLTTDQFEKDAKTALQEYLQSRQITLPQYEITSITGPAHAQVFQVICQIDGIAIITHGQGGSRREAEQIAAKDMLARLETNR